MASEAAGASDFPTSRVAMASGMVAEQAGCSIDAAFDLMSEQAAKNGESVDDVASAVIERRTRFG